MKQQPPGQLKDGIITRSKETQKSQTEVRQMPNEAYPNLKKFDEYYKEKKNLQNEMYLYQPPRIDREKCQVDFSYLNKKTEPSSDLIKKYELERMKPEDLEYYKKFIDFYQKNVCLDNFYLKGVHSVEIKAYDLLKSCDYDVNKAMSKILFPVLDQMNCLDSSISTESNSNGKSSKLYISSALNDLIGANNYEKDEWLKYINESLNRKISSKDLQILIENGEKMKINIPNKVQSEIKNTEQLTKLIKGLLGNKDNFIKDINEYYEISRTYKVQDEYFNYVGELLKKALNFEKKINEIYGHCIQYKTLQSLYNEAKTLPFKFEPLYFDNLKSRYESAQKWHQQYSNLPKHSKTRHQGNSNQTERTTLSSLKKMIELADKVNFTSNEVENLKKNVVFLEEVENEIRVNLENPNVCRNKEMLQEYLNKLDNMRFTTNLYDEIEKKASLIEWQEKKESFLNNNNNNNNESANNCYMKMKHFKHLIKFAEQKNILNVPEIKEFKEIYNNIFLWLDKMAEIFDDKTKVNNMNNSIGSNTNNYLESSGTKSIKEDEIDNMNNNMMMTIDINNNPGNCSKIPYDEFVALYNQGKSFECKFEECGYFLEKCEKFFEFEKECIRVLSNFNLNVDYPKLNVYLEMINQFNINCDVFDRIKSEISSVEKWNAETKEFLQKFYDLKNFPLSYDELINLANKESSLNILNKLLEKINLVNYEHLKVLIDSVPSFAKSSLLYQQIQQIQTNSQTLMNVDLSKVKSIEDIIRKIIDCLGNCVTYPFFQSLISLFRVKSMIEYSKQNKQKLNVVDVDIILKEAELLKLSIDEISNYKTYITQTKEWIKTKKKFLNSQSFTYQNLLAILQEGANLPLETNDFEELQNYKKIFDDEVIEIKGILNSRCTYAELEKVSNKMKNLKICEDIHEFEILKKLRDVTEDWYNIANKIIGSRQLCEMYFKKSNSNTTETEPKNPNNPIINSEFNLNENNTHDNKDNHNPINVEDSHMNNVNNPQYKSEDGKYCNSGSICYGNSSIKNNPLKSHIGETVSEFRLDEDKHEGIDSNMNNNQPKKEDNTFNEKKEIGNHLEEDELMKEAVTPISSPLSLSKVKPFKLEPAIEEENNTSMNFLGKKRKGPEPSSTNNQSTTNENIMRGNIIKLKNIQGDIKISDSPTSKNKIKIKQLPPITQLSMSECENLLSLANILPSKLKPNQKLTSAERNTIKKFQNFTYEQRCELLGQKLVLKEDIGEKFCICRRGDDSVNYMVICEICKEWFHGACIKLQKNVADNSGDYICICCARRKDNYSIYYNEEFFDYHRISYDKFCEFLDEGIKLNVEFPQMEYLLNEKNKIILWEEKYTKVVNDIYLFYSNGNQFLNETLEKKLSSLYLENEGFYAEEPSGYNAILILKQSDWFKDVYRLFENKKTSEKMAKKLLMSSYSLFNSEFISSYTSTEKKYFSFIIQKGISYVKELGKLIEKNMSNSSGVSNN